MNARHRLQLSLCASLLSLAQCAWAAGPARVITLGADVTETVYALGADRQLVGVDSTSLHPAAAQALPQLGYLRQLSAEGLLSLSPELVIATADAGPAATLDQLTAAGVRVERLPAARDGAAIAANIRRIGALLERDAAAAALGAAIDAQAAALAPASTQRPRAVFLMTGSSGGWKVAGRGTAADAALTLAGAQNLGGQHDGYQVLTAEGLIALAPDAIVVMAQRHADLGELAQRADVQQTPAGRDGRLIAVDGVGLLSFGPRTLQQIHTLRQQLDSATASASSQ